MIALAVFADEPNTAAAQLSFATALIMPSQQVSRASIYIISDDNKLRQPNR
jgi:hypothetical protein